MEKTNDLTKEPERIVSLDALRGFDMFWIIGSYAFFPVTWDMIQLGQP
jgi:hypothetical protein